MVVRRVVSYHNVIANNWLRSLRRFTNPATTLELMLRGTISVNLPATSTPKVGYLLLLRRSEAPSICTTTFPLALPRLR